MSDADLGKWEARYAAGGYAERTHPSGLLTDWLDRLPRGRALDVACGTGRNALFLAAAGYAVDAVDISPTALARGRAAAAAQALAVGWLEQDLDVGIPGAIRDARYDLILMVRYVNTPLIGQLKTQLAAGGHLLIEEHLRWHGVVVGPTSPEFRVAAGELARAAAPLRIVHSHEGPVTDPDGRPAALAQLIAAAAGP
jgi:tellurite methyltransferase